MHSRNGFEVLARLGYAARGTVYLVIAGLALFSSLSARQADAEGALSSLLGQPFGRIILSVMTVGLLGFAAWRLAQALLNADHREDDLRNYLARAGKLVSAIAYMSLAFVAGSLALGSGEGSGGGSESLVGIIMGQPFGRLLVGAIGAGVIIAGGGQVVKGVTGGYKKRMHVPQQLEKISSLVSTYGLVARGVIFAILGGFLIYAALTVDPERAGSIPEALDWVRGLPFGGVLYGLVALGLLAFAAYCGLLALYRRVDAPSAREIKHAVT